MWDEPSQIGDGQEPTRLKPRNMYTYIYIYLIMYIYICIMCIYMYIMYIYIVLYQLSCRIGWYPYVWLFVHINIYNMWICKFRPITLLPISGDDWHVHATVGSGFCWLEVTKHPKCLVQYPNVGCIIYCNNMISWIVLVISQYIPIVVG